MKKSEFKIGGAFFTGSGRWRCTDIGTRVITAIKLDHDDDPSWYNGPPYAVAEDVFDEYGMEGCTRRGKRKYDDSGKKDIVHYSPPPQEETHPVALLLNELRGSRSPERNDRFEDRLIAMGQAAVPFLRKAATTRIEPDHLRAAALRALHSIEEVRSQDTLLEAANDKSAIVREAAVEGLLDMLSDPVVHKKVTNISVCDPSKVIRTAATEALDSEALDGAGSHAAKALDVPRAKKAQTRRR